MALCILKGSNPFKMGILFFFVNTSERFWVKLPPSYWRKKGGKAPSILLTRSQKNKSFWRIYITAGLHTSAIPTKCVADRSHENIMIKYDKIWCVNIKHMHPGSLCLPGFYLFAKNVLSTHLTWSPATDLWFLFL
jgi:hypothetical protein